MSYSPSDNAEQLRGIESFIYQDRSPLPSAEAWDPALGEAAPAQLTSEGSRSNDSQVSALVAQARAEGQQEGRNQIRAACEAELAKERKLLAEAVARFQLEKAEYYSKVEVEVVHLALAIAARILHRESQIDRLLLVTLVKLTLEKLQQGSKVVVRIAAAEAGKWQEAFREQAAVEIKAEATLGHNDCRIETEMGTADLGLTAQLKEIEQGFCDLLALRPQPK